MMVMSTNYQPSGTGTVIRKQKDGTSVHIPCPESIISYKKFMGGVDQGDQLHGYYRCRSKSRKLYKYVFFFLLDVAITNAYILMKHRSCPFKNIKSFQLQLAKDLIASIVVAVIEVVEGRLFTHFHSVTTLLGLTMTTADPGTVASPCLQGVWRVVVPQWQTIK